MEKVEGPQGMLGNDTLSTLRISGIQSRELLGSPSPPHPNRNTRGGPKTAGSGESLCPGNVVKLPSNLLGVVSHGAPIPLFLWVLR